LNGKTQAYFEAVALMITISKSKEDRVDVATWARLLPEGYDRPIFKRGKKLASLDPASPSISAVVSRHPPALLLKLFPYQLLHAPW
jgi:hypothetical protein